MSDDGKGTGPNHIAIVMDGNGRWGSKRGLQRIAGHKAGAKAVQKIVERSTDIGVRYLTLFAFSTENWMRSSQEVSGLMTLFRHYLKKESAQLDDAGVRLRFIGDRAKFDTDMQQMMTDLEQKSRDNNKLNLTVAMSYGGRDEIVRAVKSLAAQIKSGEISEEDINEALITQTLDTSELPDPDLIIRTSGEQRVSGFLTWQSAYSELMFTDTLWPDFTPEEYENIVAEYKERDRRFGGMPICP